MALYRLPILILTMSLVYIFIVPDEPFLFKLFFKLIPMGMIIYFAFRIAPKRKSKVYWLLLTGLLFSILGDATLHWFLIGMMAFFLGHLFYTIGFFTQATYTRLRIFALIPLIIYGLVFGRILIPALRDARLDMLVFPVIAYIIIISLMCWSAILTGNKSAVFGSLLFIISDSLLAWNLFINPISLAEPLIMTSYYGAQFLIAMSLDSIVEGAKRIVW